MISQKKFASLSLVLLLFLGLHPGCAKIRLPRILQADNVLLITIDTLRADHLGCYGYKGIQTPNIDGLANEGVTFKHAYTPVPITLPSHTSILTGLYPIQTGVRNNGTCRVSRQTTTLAEILHQQNYRTAAFVSAYVLDSRYGLDQGFDYYDDTLNPEKEQAMSLYNERNAELATQSAIKWISHNTNAKFFAWIHYFDPHANYQPPSPFAEQYATQPYDGEIAYTDYWIGILINQLKNMGLLDNTLVVLTSDHGEGLGEHNELTHATFIYDTTLHVPLIFRYPKKIPRKKIIQEFVRTIDIMPTILSTLDFPSPPVEGIDLMNLIRGKTNNLGLDLYCETLFPQINYGWSPLEGIRNSDWKYIKAPKSELYHLAQDPGELYNFYDRQKGPAQQFHQRMEELKKRLTDRKAPQDTRLALDKEAEERLKSLGYIWATKEDKARPEAESLPDPKDMVHTQRDIDLAAGMMNEGQYEQAKEILIEIVRQNPDNVFVHFILGRAYTFLNQRHRAQEEFLQVIRLNPEYGDVRVCLGIVYLEEGEYEKALQVFTESLALNADQYEVYYNLGLTYTRLGEENKALEYFQQALAIKNDQPDIYNNMGVLLANQGRIDEAIKAYTQAITLDSKNPKPYQNLAFFYQQQGQTEEAQKILSQAINHIPDDPDLYLTQASFAMQMGDNQAAIHLYRDILKQDPKNLQAQLNLGLAYGSNGQTEEAIQEYEKVLQLNPQNAPAFFNLGVAYAKKQNLSTAINFYQQAIKINPGYLEASLNLGVLYQQQGNIREACEEWKKALQHDPQNVKAHFNLGNAALSQRDFAQAASEYQKALETDPSHAEAHFGLGVAYLNQGKLSEAISAWEETVRLNPYSLEARVNLAIAYMDEGRPEPARRMLYQVLQLNPGLPIAHQLLKKSDELKQDNMKN